MTPNDHGDSFLRNWGIRYTRLSMRTVVFFFLLAGIALGQTAPYISPAIASKHLLKSPQPEYPPLAQQARIQGVVVLEIQIDKTGTVAVYRLVSGHPMLAPAAIRAVNLWKYKPFEIDGKPATVRTFVMVPFGNVAANTAQGEAELAVQGDFWMAERSAEAALSHGGYASAEEQLDKAKALFSADSNAQAHLEERWQWATTMGRLDLGEKKYDEAETRFKNALALQAQRRPADKESPEIATSLANLAVLYAAEQKVDLANDNASQALAIYQKDFKSTHSDSARDLYGQAIAQLSLMLLKNAGERKDAAETSRQCILLADFQRFLGAPDHDLMAASCHTTADAP